MPLDDYAAKRDFARTPEPSGGAAADAGDGTGRARDAGGGIFVVQKHDASHLHYDVRLEMDGALKSWAVPKGPSLDPHDKRLAVHVEDHPIEYATFAGVIPKGEYGAGTVEIFDHGTWEPAGESAADPQGAYAAGQLKFVLHGSRLAGRFVLVRMKPRPKEKREMWLLIKERDEHARPSAEFDVLSEVSTSADLSDMPIDAPFQLATLVDRAPDGDGWIHEVKYDGYRLRAVVREGTPTILTRNGHDWTDRFPGIAHALRRLPVSSALLDGEAVVLDERGVSDFSALQAALAKGRSAVISYVAFDLLYLDGRDLRGLPLAERKALLRDLLDRASSSGDIGPEIRYAEHVEGQGETFHARACEFALEGSVSKRADRPYAGGRTRDWLKVKCQRRQEFVVGGFTEPGGSRAGFGALLLGVWTDTGDGGRRLEYAGRVGTGFSKATLLELRGRLDALRSDSSPFDASVPKLPGKSVCWVRPELVVEVAYREWTYGSALRQASFKGVRDDIDPLTVRRETPAASDENSRTESEVAVRGVRLSNPSKPLFSGGELTKLELARYYDAVGERMLAHAGGRLLTLVRCPSGRGKGCFYQKHPGQDSFSYLRTLDLEEKGEPSTYMFADTVEALVELAQRGVLEIHTWGSRASDPLHPDIIVFDLDPGPGVSWTDVQAGALLLRERLGAFGMRSFAKATGGSGLHVVAPIEPDADFGFVRSFARSLAADIAAREPGRYTARMAKRVREGRIFIDYVRNSYGATSIAAYSTRARAGAPVAVPLDWAEVESAESIPRFDVASAIERASAEPWGDLSASQASSRTLRAAASAIS